MGYSILIIRRVSEVVVKLERPDVLAGGRMRHCQ
jgi:hypothetical protein